MPHKHLYLLIILITAALAGQACHGEEPRGEAPAPGGALYALRLDSSPRGALVLRGDRILCRATPCVVRLPAGQHALSMHAERHAPRHEAVELAADTSLEWELSPDFGLVTVEVEGGEQAATPQLSLEIDGEARGQTPVEGLALRPGRHKVEVYGPCHRALSQEIELRRGESLRLSLRPEPRRATLHIVPRDLQGSEVEASVVVDGAPLGQAPGRFEVPVCAGLIVLSSQEHGTFSSQVLLEEGREQQLQATLGQGVVSLEGVDFALVQPGTFSMGSPSTEAGRDRDEVAHEVTLTRPYLLQVAEVSQAQWLSLMGNKPSHHVACPSCPVEMVSWWDALAYLNALSRQQGLEACYALEGCTGMAGVDLDCQAVRARGHSCRGYRLPTEAEWEYAARAGEAGPRYGEAEEIAWYSANARGSTQPVMTRAPNAWGLHDMLGNVYEWTWDKSAAYTSAAVTDPEGPSQGTDRAIRGGCWQYDRRRIRAAYRDSGAPSLRNNRLGFRAARSMSP